MAPIWLIPFEAKFKLLHVIFTVIVTHFFVWDNRISMNIAQTENTKFGCYLDFIIGYLRLERR